MLVKIVSDQHACLFCLDARDELRKLNNIGIGFRNEVSFLCLAFKYYNQILIQEK
jgi:hypothetical protein